ncbi:hypothetical protein JTB14_004804 [Gonioctena quinquepunctata]|nr:hypothetical protein JTB14_004804 [Gonioctena quinquepunctata]
MCACQLCPESGNSSISPDTVATPVPNSLRTTPAEEGCRCRLYSRQRSANPEAQEDQLPTPREEWTEIDADKEEATDQEDFKVAVGPKDKVLVFRN